MIATSRTPFLLFALALTPLGCSATSPRDDFTPMISEKARSVSDENARTATVFDDRLEFPLAAQGWIDGINAGDVLVSGYDFGFLRGVTSIESTSEAIVVYTESAALTDIVEQGATENIIDYSALDVTSAEGFPELSPQALAGDPYAFTTDLSGRLVPLGDGVTARITKGLISFKPSLDIGASVKGWSLVEAHALANGEFTSDFEVEIEGALATNVTKEVMLWQSKDFEVPMPPIGWVPVKCAAALAVKAGFTLDAKGQVHVTLAQTFNLNGSMGIRYAKDGGWEKVNSFQPTWTPQPPKIGADVNVDATGYLSGGLTFGFYGLSKKLGTGGQIEIMAKPYLRISYDSAEPAPGWGLYGGMQIDASPSLQVLHKSLLSTTIKVYESETLLLPAEGSNDPAPIDSGNCSDGQEDGIETAVDCGGSCANACSMGAHCLVDNDCTTGACGANGECMSAGCDNGVQDAGEIDVDCGGSCPACSGGTCQDAADCTSGNCMAGKCEESLDCFDGLQNGTEMGIDCGGGCDPCYADLPANCFDGEISGDEEQIDCGGSCAPCGGGGGGTCDGTGDCNTCTTCAEQGACAAVAAACMANSDCVNLANCVYSCADQACVDNCFATYPAGDPDFTAYDVCVTCTECYGDCGGVNVCQ